MAAQIRGEMKISISATNPCHLFPLAVELAGLGHLGCYYSGYPKWKLPDIEHLPVRTHSFRTNVVYGMLKFLPTWARPESRALFLWQDRGFDRWTGAHLEPCDFIHAMPGQALHTLQKAKTAGVRTVLNHATGPVREWVKIMNPEYRRVGLKLSDVCPYDDDYFRREDEEYAAADFHCAASTVVRDQLLGMGIEPGRIWVVPYGADDRIFFPANESAPKDFRIAFAGQLGLRKGLRTLLSALESPQCNGWRIDFHGAVLPESQQDLAAYGGKCALHFHGPVSQQTLAEAFRKSSVLVLPSIEEGFGLVVPQALNCGVPCIVSDRVGAKDLIAHHRNGSIFEVENADALLQELAWWKDNPFRLNEKIGWRAPAEKLIALSKSA